MNRSALLNKAIYGGLIALLVIPMYLLSRPAVRQADGRLSEGGKLAQLRRTYRLSQAQLGEIDPASESMKLATLGMRGIAANLLWERANRYKREQDWDNLTATLNQISKLQPNFISVWQFQGWNLAYNVSVEFDDYRSRYHWVKRGIDFLREGVRYNPEEPVLTWEIGWTFGHKIGRADERVQFRRLYREDDDFHESMRGEIDMDNTLGADNRPDNWLTGREWFLRGERLVDLGVPIRGRLVDPDTSGIKRGKTPLIFHSHPPKWLISYAEVIEEEGYLDEKAKYAWTRAGQSWAAFGERKIPTTYGFEIQLDSAEALQQRVEQLHLKLDDLLPGVREQIRQEKHADLPAELQEVLQMPADEQTDEQWQMAVTARKKLEVTAAEIVQRAPAEKRREADRLLRLIQAAELMFDAVKNYREQVNYPYWDLRCQVEQTDTAILARRYVYEADQALSQKGDLETMRKKYELAWVEWAKIFQEHPVLMEDTTAEDLMEAVNRYRWVLQQLEQSWPPPDFPLQKLLEVQQSLYSSDGL